MGRNEGVKMAGSKTLMAAACAAVALAGASLAAAQPAPPPAADQTPIDPAKMALAHKLFEMQMGQTNLPALLKSLDQQMFAQAMKGLPNADDATQKRILAAVEKTQAELMPRMLDGMAAAYARHLSQKELEDTVAFYSTPSGQAILQKTPLIMTDVIGGLGQMLPRMRHDVFEAICADNGCTPAQREAIQRIEAQSDAPASAPPRP